MANGVTTAGGTAEAEWVSNQQKWARGWRRILFPGVFLLYLIQTAAAVEKDSRGAAALAGYLILAAFCACYIVALLSAWRSGWGRFWGLLAALAALCGAEAVFAHGDAFVMCVFIVTVGVARLGARALPLVVGLTLVAALVPAAVPSWHSGVDTGEAVAIPMVALAMFGFFNVIHGSRALAQARSEVARLAAENERARIARDLHDLLGHSLTTITVKAGLAHRLGASDPARAIAEIGEVEALSRQALSDVRATVANYREVTLSGELATARELLRAAGIVADLPGATDAVDPAHQELFGWVLREGLTNVVRHAHATRCAVTLSASSVEIVDDGIGGAAIGGSGLTGLRQRVEASGGTVIAGPIAPGGWRLLVRLGTADAVLSA
jgi:two-component system sensor histidine kinase DesK